MEHNTPFIYIKELDPDLIEPSFEHANDVSYKGGGSKITVIGRPGFGKSFLIQSLVYDKQACFPVAVVMSGTEDSNSHYSARFPSTFVYNELRTDILDLVIKRQKLSKKYLDQSWLLLLLDDCMDDPKMFNTPIFQGLYKNGRHWNMLFILSLQYCMDIKPVIRNAVDGTFILREPVMKNRKAIYENYASIIPSFSLFCSIMDQLTADHTALYIHNRIVSNNWQDCVFWYKAHAVPSDWKFPGSPWYWRYHEDRYNPQSEEKF